METNFEDYSNMKIYKTFKKGDIITLNIPKVEHIRSLIKSGKLHPFSGPNFDFTPGKSKWTDGVTATVTSVIKSKDQLKYKFNDINDEYEYVDSYWFFKPVKNK